MAQAPNRSRKRSEPLAKITTIAPITVVIPTYQEAENIPLMLESLKSLRDEGVEISVLFMDDDSQDGSAEAVDAAGYDWARLVTRTENRGLSPAVIDGMKLAEDPVLVCMDGDLSHPPETIPALVLALETGQQMAIGSRYVPGGSTDDDWGIGRWLTSRVATLLASPLTKVKDPMSGFFALRRSDFLAARDLHPVGYKIGLELIVKCGFENIGEVPIHFTDRTKGESKLTFKEQLKYLQHLRRLYIYKFTTAMELAQFLTVGASGVVVNLTILTLLAMMGAADSLALAGGVGVSVVTNFILNRRFTFSYARHRNAKKQFAGFVIASMTAMLINYSVALSLRKTAFADMEWGLQLSALVGIAAGMAFNFLGNRFIVFRKNYIDDGKDDQKTDA